MEKLDQQQFRDDLAGKIKAEKSKTLDSLADYNEKDRDDVIKAVGERIKDDSKKAKKILENIKDFDAFGMSRYDDSTVLGIKYLISKKVHQGMRGVTAEDSEKAEIEAEKLAALELLNRFEDACERVGGAEAREFLFSKREENSSHKGFNQKQWEKGMGEPNREKRTLQSLSRSHNDFVDEVDYDILDWYRAPIRSAEYAISLLSFDEALDRVEKIQNRIDQINKERLALEKEKLPLIFLKTKVTEETLDKFLNSSLEKFLSPNVILGHILSLSYSPNVVEKIISRYGNKINYMEFKIYGKDSIFKDFENRNELESSISEQRLQEMIKEISKQEGSIPSGRGYLGENREYRVYTVSDPLKISEVLEYLNSLLDNRVSIKNIDQYIRKIKDAFDLIPSRYLDHFINRLKDDLAEIEEKLNKK